MRIDFVSAFTTIEIAAIRLRKPNGATVFEAESAEAFDQIRVAGDATRLPHARSLRIQVTGLDPQLYLPHLARTGAVPEPVTVELKLRVSASERSG